MNVTTATVEGRLPQVTKVIAEMLGLTPEEIGPDDNLLEAHGADSLDLVEITMAIEDELHIEIPDEAVEKAVTARAFAEATFKRD